MTYHHVFNWVDLSQSQIAWKLRESGVSGGGGHGDGSPMGGGPVQLHFVLLAIQRCPTLCNPMDCSLLGPSVHGLLQTRILECVAMPSSRAFSQPRD